MKYYKYKIENLVKINNIVTIHYLELGNNFNSKLEKHDFWEMVYVVKDNLICYKNKSYETINAGQVIFYRPNELHCLKCPKDSSSIAIVISFDCKSEAVHFFANKVLDVDNDTSRFLFSIINEAKKTFALPFSDPYIKKMPLLKNPTLGGLQLIKNYLELFLISLIRDKTEINGKNKIFITPNQLGSVCLSVIKYLEENVTERLLIEDVVAKVNYSKSFLFRTFKAQTGSTIIAYFNGLKIEKAKKLLEDTDLSVTDIAYKLGYDSQSYFTKAFKKKVMYSPLSYRKIFRNK